LDKSAVVLAGGFSSRFGQDKGLLPLTNKPIIKHILDAIDNLVDEQLVVVSSKLQAKNYAEIVGSNVRVLVDTEKLHGPLVGALTGFKEAHGEYALLLPCDTPFVSGEVLALLSELCINKTAVIPRWPNGYIEPLQAVYCRKLALEVAKTALRDGELNMRAMVDKLRGVRYISTMVLQQLDPELRTFFNINTPPDLKKAELMLRRKK